MFYNAVFNLLYFMEIFHNLITLSLVRLDSVVNPQYVSPSSWDKMDASSLAIASLRSPTGRGKGRMTGPFFVRTHFRSCTQYR